MNRVVPLWFCIAGESLLGLMLLYVGVRLEKAEKTAADAQSIAQQWEQLFEGSCAAPPSGTVVARQAVPIAALLTPIPEPPPPVETARDRDVGAGVMAAVLLLSATVIGWALGQGRDR
jgi:hypothetical protein